MTKEQYKEKLKHPKWQKRRLEILTSKGLFCHCCGDTESILDIHHRRYTGKDPWDAPDEDLIPVCRKCHAIISDKSKMLSLIGTMSEFLKHNDGILFLTHALARETIRQMQIKSKTTA